jgi:hypothetical protein
MVSASRRPNRAGHWAIWRISLGTTIPNWLGVKHAQQHLPVYGQLHRGITVFRDDDLARPGLL